MNMFLFAALATLISATHPIAASAAQTPIANYVVAPAPKPIAKNTTPHIVPFYSQFTDISSPTWKKQGCGIASLAMVIGYYKQDPISVDGLLNEGIKAGAYSDAGWTYSGLIGVAKKHGMQGSAYDLAASGSAAAYAQFTKALAGGPVIASVHYKFDPKSTIPHLVVINSIKDGVVYYNDPAATGGQKQVSVDTFTKAWKMRYIVIRPQGTA